MAIPRTLPETIGDRHASVLCSVLRAAFGGCALHAPAGAVARDDIAFLCPGCLICGNRDFFLPLG